MWTGLILAGGRSRRMGSDKATQQVCGRSLLLRAIDLIRAAGGEPLVVGPPRSRSEVDGARQADESEAGGGLGGPLPALRHGLALCASVKALALACDLPLLTVDFARFLLAEVDGFDAVVPRAAGELQVLAAAYRSTCLPAINRHLASGGLSVHGFLEMIRVKILEEQDLLPFGGSRILLNVNTPEDLARAAAVLEGRER